MHVTVGSGIAPTTGQGHAGRGLPLLLLLLLEALAASANEGK